MKSGEQITKTSLKARQAQDKSNTIADQRIFLNSPYVLMLTHQHIKYAPGKLMNILLKPSPKVLT